MLLEKGGRSAKLKPSCTPPSAKFSKIRHSARPTGGLLPVDVPQLPFPCGLPWDVLNAHNCPFSAVFAAQATLCLMMPPPSRLPKPCSFRVEHFGCSWHAHLCTATRETLQGLSLS